MPTKRRRRTRQQRTTWSDEVVRWLTTGEGEEPSELLIASRRAAELSVEMGRRVEEGESAWIGLRDEILPKFIRANPGERPAGWWWFEPDAQHPGPEDEAQVDYLERHGLLTDAERRALAKLEDEDAEPDAGGDDADDE